jgi:hypothetical protein
MAKTDKRKKVRVDYAQAAKPTAADGDEEEDSDDSSDEGSLFSKEESD